MVNTRYLLDTHCLIWFQLNNGHNPENVLKIIQNPDNVIIFSQVSLFEIAIKQNIGKLPLFEPSVEEVFHQGVNDGFEYLNIQNRHLFEYDKVPLLEKHRDPFDRLLIATAIAENATILSGDEKFKLYADIVQLTWR